MHLSLGIYFRSVALALGASLVVAAMGFLGDQLDLGPGRVPIWDADGRGYWLTGLALAALVGMLYQRVDRDPVLQTDPQEVDMNHGDMGEFPTRWILPMSVVLAAVLFLGVYRGTTAIAAGALITFAGLTAGSLSGHLMRTGVETGQEKARLVYTLVVHSVTFVAMAMIYIHKVRSVFSATAVMMMGILLLLALTEGEDRLLQRRLVYALVGGLMLGQVTWGLNYWQATGWTGGAVLLICFYFVGGLILTHLRQGLQPRDVAEYGTVGAAAFAIVVYSLFF